MSTDFPHAITISQRSISWSRVFKP
ncbi:hypothetical protein YPPY10_2404, partial [Yersinia pestis PY-10]